MPDAKGFLASAREFIKNPLGIIGLFVSIIYLLSTVVLIKVIPKLETDTQRLPLIYFTIIFPVLILVAFVYLVAKHHHKLYAPADFKDEKNFLQAMDPAAQRRKMDEEIDDIVGGENETIKMPEGFKTRSRGAADDLLGTPREPGKSAEYRGFLSAQYLIAEDLAFRAIEAERGFKIQRHVELQQVSGRVSHLDGIALTNESAYVIEVKFSRDGQNAQKGLFQLEKYVNEFRLTIDRAGAPRTVKGILVMVLAGGDIEKAREDLARRAGSSDNLEVVVYSFDELKKRFGVTA